LNQDQQAAYTKQIQSNNSQISSLRAQQLAANQRLVGSGKVTIISGGSCGGGYPGSAAGPWGNWGCNYGLDASVDNWGMYNRECVSYTAWKVYQAYGYMPNWGGVGNANQWPGDADRYNIPRGSTPKVGSVAIGTNSYYFGSVGHAMWVEAVYGDGTILVSQYNFAGPGQYSTMRISASLMSTFIYFGG
jgi:surface antigen